MAVKKAKKSSKHKKRTIQISEITQKKLNRLNKRLHKRNLLQHELIEKKKKFVTSGFAKSAQKLQFSKPADAQKHILDDLLLVQQTTNLNSDLLLKKLSFPPTCKTFVVNGECSPDCRKKHDLQLRYFYLNKFKGVLNQIQKHFYNDRKEGDNTDEIIFSNETEKYGFINLFSEYYKDLKNSIYDYEMKVDEFKRTYYKDEEDTETEDNTEQELSLDELIKSINEKIKQASRNNKVFRTFKNLLHSYNDKSSNKLTNYTLFNNISKNDVKTHEQAIQLNRILNMLVPKKKKQLSTPAGKDKGKTSTFGLATSDTKSSYKKPTNKHGFFLCNDCGYSISIKDNDMRLQKHFNGRTHMKYVNIWGEFARISYIFQILKVDPKSNNSADNTREINSVANGYVRRTNRNKKPEFTRNKRMMYYYDDVPDEDMNEEKTEEASIIPEVSIYSQKALESRPTSKSDPPSQRRVLMPTLEY